MKERIGFGGGCHWCTEAVFQKLKGVSKVEQGWIKSKEPYNRPAEAVIVHFDPTIINLSILTSIHLSTHSCTSDHLMREKYRSAIYVFNDAQGKCITSILTQIQEAYTDPILTKVLLFSSFEMNDEKYLDYHQKNAGNQFCQRYIEPKFSLLQKEYFLYLK